MRRRAHFDGTQRDFVLYMEARINEASLDDEENEDDRLRLIFTCCHPALPPEGQVALTLREIWATTRAYRTKCDYYSPVALPFNDTLRSKAKPTRTILLVNLTSR